MKTLEKIKTEIEAVEPKSHVQYGMRWADTTLMIPLHKVMQIIDKYNPKEEEWYRAIVEAFEPSDDAVSRQAVDEIKELMTDINGDTVYAVRMSEIRQLPSVRPQENTGHWIKENINVRRWLSHKEVRTDDTFFVAEKEQKQEKSCNTCNNYDKRNGCVGTYDYMCECTDNDYKHWIPYQKGGE